MASQEPDECNWLMRSSLRVRNFTLEYHVPSYAQFLTDETMRVSYRLYRTLLQMLTWRTPPDRLVLKDPSHLWHLEPLLEVLPDAHLVHVHRDPLQVLPSAVRLCSTMRAMSSEQVDLREIAADSLREFERGLALATAVRNRDPGRFVDVRYPQLVRDPLAEVRRLYRELELPWSDSVGGRMQRWLDASGHRQHRAGQYEDLSALGLEPSAVRKAFAAYREQFQMAEE
jgi:hypothetical protein